MIILRHYSPEPFAFDPTRTYDQRRDAHCYGKPRGLWLSVDEGWKEWCQDESFNLDGLVHSTEFDVRDDARILRIQTLLDLDIFHRDHAHRAVASPADAITVWDRATRSEKAYGHSIDWAFVAERYDGILIAPYIWQRRLEYSWYYGWDCASACIWNPGVLTPKGLL